MKPCLHPLTYNFSRTQLKRLTAIKHIYSTGTAGCTNAHDEIGLGIISVEIGIYFFGVGPKPTNILLSYIYIFIRHGTLICVYQALFAEQLKKHSTLTDQIEVYLTAQPKILDAVTKANVNFVPVRQKIDLTLHQ